MWHEKLHATTNPKRNVTTVPNRALLLELSLYKPSLHSFVWRFINSIEIKKKNVNELTFDFLIWKTFKLQWCAAYWWNDSKSEWTLTPKHKQSFKLSDRLHIMNINVIPISNALHTWHLTFFMELWSHSQCDIPVTNTLRKRRGVDLCNPKQGILTQGILEFLNRRSRVSVLVRDPAAERGGGWGGHTKVKSPPLHQGPYSCQNIHWARDYVQLVAQRDAVLKDFFFFFFSNWEF